MIVEVLRGEKQILLKRANDYSQANLEAKKAIQKDIETSNHTFTFDDYRVFTRDTSQIDANLQKQRALNLEHLEKIRRKGLKSV